MALWQLSCQITRLAPMTDTILNFRVCLCSVAVTQFSLAFFAVCFGDVAIEEREATNQEHKPFSMKGDQMSRKHSRRQFVTATANSPQLQSMIDEVKDGHLDRRTFIRRMVGLGLTAPMAAQVLALGGVAIAESSSGL